MNKAIILASKASENWDKIKTFATDNLPAIILLAGVAVAVVMGIKYLVKHYKG